MSDEAKANEPANETKPEGVQTSSHDQSNASTDAKQPGEGQAEGAQNETKPPEGADGTEKDAKGDEAEAPADDSTAGDSKEEDTDSKEPGVSSVE